MDIDMDYNEKSGQIKDCIDLDKIVETNET